MARNRQTDSGDKRRPNGMKRVEEPWQKVVGACGQGTYTPPGLEHVWLCLAFYRGVDRWLARVETVQWTEGTRWHGSLRRGGKGGWVGGGGGGDILLQSGNKAGRRRWNGPASISSYWAIRWQCHSSTAGRGGPAAADSCRRGGILTREEYLLPLFHVLSK